MTNDAISNQQVNNQKVNNQKVTIKTQLLTDLILKLTGIHLQGKFNLVSENGKKNLIKEFDTLVSSCKEYGQDIPASESPLYTKEVKKVATFLSDQSEKIHQLNTSIQSSKINLENIEFLSEQVHSFINELDYLLENVLIIDYLESHPIKPSSTKRMIKVNKNGTAEAKIHLQNNDRTDLLTISNTTHPDLFDGKHFYDSVVALEPIKTYPFIATLNNKSNQNTCRFYSIDTFIKLNGINPETNEEFHTIYLIKQNNKKCEGIRLSSDLNIKDTNKTTKKKKEKKPLLTGIFALTIILTSLCLLLFALLYYYELLTEKNRIKNMFKKISPEPSLPPHIKSVTEKNNQVKKVKSLSLHSTSTFSLPPTKDDIIYSKNINKSVHIYGNIREVIFMITSTVTLFNKTLNLSQQISEDITFIKEITINDIKETDPITSLKNHQKLAIGFDFIEKLSTDEHCFDYKDTLIISEKYIKPINIVNRIQKCIKYYRILEDSFSVINNQNFKTLHQNENQNRYQFILNNHQRISSSKMDTLFKLIESEKYIYNDIFSDIQKLEEHFKSLGELIHQQSEFIATFFSFVRPTTRNDNEEGH